MKIYADFPNWKFEVEETSAGVYEVKASDKFGHQVSSQGIDPYKIIDDAKKWIIKNGLMK